MIMYKFLMLSTIYSNTSHLNDHQYLLLQMIQMI